MYAYDQLITSQLKENKMEDVCHSNMDLSIVMRWWILCEFNKFQLFYTHTSRCERARKCACVRLCDDLQNSDVVPSSEEIGLEGLYLCMEQGVWGYIYSYKC